PAEEQRTERHAPQFHRQYDAEACWRNTPLCVDTRRREADRHDVEAIERIQRHGEPDDDVLQSRHLRMVECFAGIGLHAALFIIVTLVVMARGAPSPMVSASSRYMNLCTAGPRLRILQALRQYLVHVLREILLRHDAAQF